MMLVDLARQSVRRSAAALAIAVLLVSAQPAEALLINPTTSAVATGTQTGQSQINAAIDDYIGTPLSSYRLYTQNVGGSEEGVLAASYQTTFNNSPSDPADALIEYVGGDIVGAIAWLLVKGGASTPSWYLFNLTTLGWNGTDDLKLVGFWPAQGAISHVTLYGKAASVPEPATLSLLGAGLAGLLLSRRRRQVPSA